MKSSTAIAALLVTTLALSSLPTLALAQQAAPAAPQGQMQMPPAGQNADRPMRMAMRAHMQNDDMRGGLLNMVCSDNGAEQLDIGFTRLAYRITDLSAEQKTLLDTLKTKALAAQKTFAETCAAARPAKAADAATPKPDMVARLKTNIAVDTARLQALNAVLPDLEAFFNSLTDAQKAALLPHGRMGNEPGRNGHDRQDQRQPGNDGHA